MQDDASYTLADLLMDDSFREWIKSGGQKNDHFWQAWMEKHPDKAHLIEEARQMLLAFEVDPFLFSPERKEKLRNNIEAISKNQNPHVSNQEGDAKQPINVHRFIHWPQIAAATLLLLTLTSIVYVWLQRDNNLVEYRTGSNEIRQIMLPDSSLVTLNANTTLSIPARWDRQNTRKVWLDGEAYFEVEKHKLISGEKEGALREETSSHQKFMVFTNNLVVEVLGTKFNVNNRNNHTEVVLNSGSVKLQLSEQEIMMEPGDYVAVSSQKKEVTKKAINPENYTAWRSGQLYFDSASVEEIKQTLEDNYGIEIIFEDWKKAEGVGLRGMFPTDNLDLLLQALANTTRTEMTKKGNQVFYK